MLRTRARNPAKNLFLSQKENLDTPERKSLEEASSSCSLLPVAWVCVHLCFRGLSSCSDAPPLFPQTKRNIFFTIIFIWVREGVGSRKMSRKSYLFASSRLVCDLKRVLGGKSKSRDEKSLEIRFYEVSEKTARCHSSRCVCASLRCRSRKGDLRAEIQSKYLPSQAQSCERRPQSVSKAHQNTRFVTLASMTPQNCGDSYGASVTLSPMQGMRNKRLPPSQPAPTRLVITFTFLMASNAQIFKTDWKFRQVFPNFPPSPVFTHDEFYSGLVERQFHFSECD